MTQRPRIAHLITGLHPGGAEIMLVELLRQSARSHFDPVVISMLDGGVLRDEIRALGIPVHSLGLGSGFPDPRAIRSLAHLFRDERIAVVQTWMYHANLVGGFAARAAGSLPVAWGIHHSNLAPAYIKRSTLAIAKMCAPLSGRLPDAIVCCADASKRVHSEIGYAKDRMLVIPNGFDLDRFKPDPAARDRLRVELGLPADARLVGMLARFNPQKDHRNFTRAAAAVAADDPAAHFVLCGGDVTWDNAQLAAWVDESGARSRFHLLGRRADTGLIHAALDVGVLSSESGEAFPLVIGEAMACGVPCAVTDIGDSAIVVNGLGRVVPPKDPDALARGILELLRLPEGEREQLGIACRTRIADRYSLMEIARRYDEIWQLIERRAWPVAA